MQTTEEIDSDAAGQADAELKRIAQEEEAAAARLGLIADGDAKTSAIQRRS